MHPVLEEIGSRGFVSVLSIDDAAHARPLAEALLRAGLPAVEVTLRTDAALDAVRAMAAVDGLLLGAGTVLSADDAKAAVDAGATYLVTPGLNEEVVAAANDLGVPVLPGVATATELDRARRLRLAAVKFFPAGILGGPAAIRALSAPFPTMRFVPTGGVTADNLGDYLSVPAVLACGGSWPVDKKLLAAGDFAEVERRANAVVATVGESRP